MPREKNGILKKIFNCMKKIIDGRKSRKLTPKQLRFVYEYCTRTLLGSASASEAARRAGYSETVARKMAYEMQDPNKYPLVAEAIYDLERYVTGESSCETSVIKMLAGKFTINPEVTN